MIKMIFDKEKGESKLGILDSNLLTQKDIQLKEKLSKASEKIKGKSNVLERHKDFVNSFLK